MGFLSQKKTRLGQRVWCVHNEPTGRIIRSRGKLRCYASRRVAERVLAKLDCHYTGRRCGQAPPGFKIPEGLKDEVE